LFLFRRQGEMVRNRAGETKTKPRPIKRQGMLAFANIKPGARRAASVPPDKMGAVFLRLGCLCFRVPRRRRFAIAGATANGR
jgi:hypothetical protein